MTPQREPELPAPESVAIRTVAMPSDTNPAGDIFGGWLMWQMDLAAGSVATKAAGGRCATAAVNGMTFLNPVLVGDEVSLFAQIISRGRTSLQIKVEAWRRPRQGSDVERVTQATFVFVAIGDDRQPRQLPPRPD